MRKIILMCAILLSSLTASAQYFSDGDNFWRGGITAGGGFSNVTNCNAKMTPSYHFGINVERHFGLGFAQTALYVESLGMKDMTDGAIKGSLDAGYLSMPLHLGFDVNMGDACCFFLQAGPLFRYGFHGSDIESKQLGTSNYFDYANRFDCAVSGKIGIEFGDPEESVLQISIDASYGLKDVFKEGGKNWGIRLGLSYMLYWD